MAALLGGCLGFSPGGGDDDPEPTAFRVDSLELRDPHPFIAGTDSVGTINGLVSDTMSVDGPPGDGFLDVSIAIVMMPLDQSGASTPMLLATTDCTAPASSTRCVEPGPGAIDTTATNDVADPCLDVLPGTLGGGYFPLPTPPGAPCFASDAESFALPIGPIALPLEDVQIAATYGADPATRLSGLLRGFTASETLDAIALPETIPLVGGESLGSLLLAEDRDVGPGGAEGYYFYFDFAAGEVPYDAD